MNNLTEADKAEIKELVEQHETESYNKLRKKLLDADLEHGWVVYHDHDRERGIRRYYIPSQKVSVVHDIGDSQRDCCHVILDSGAAITVPNVNAILMMTAVGEARGIGAANCVEIGVVKERHHVYSEKGSSYPRPLFAVIVEARDGAKQ